MNKHGVFEWVEEPAASHDIHVFTNVLQIFFLHSMVRLFKGFCWVFKSSSTAACSIEKLLNGRYGAGKSSRIPKIWQDIMFSPFIIFVIPTL